MTRTPDAEGMQGAINRAKELVAKDPKAFMAGQFDNRQTQITTTRPLLKKFSNKWKDALMPWSSGPAQRVLLPEFPAT